MHKGAILAHAAEVLHQIEAIMQEVGQPTQLHGQHAIEHLKCQLETGLLQ